MVQKQAGKSQVLESGNIYFIFRPRVEQHEPKGVRDVERFYMVLSPEGKKVHRMIVVGQKTMPDIHDGGERSWGFVDMVTKNPTEIEKVLPAGEGVYAIVRHGDHTHLAYSLELPRDPDKVQRDLRIEQEGSYIITVKNPEKGSPEGAGLRGEQKADFPKKLREVFRDRRFADCDPPEFLDYEGAELILIGAKEDPQKELGVRLPAEKETEQSADIFKELKMRRSEHPVAPLFEGKWE